MKVVVLLALATVLVGCGSSDEGFGRCPALGTDDVDALRECIEFDNFGISALLGPPSNEGEQTLSVEAFWNEEDELSVVGFTTVPFTDATVFVETVRGGRTWIVVGESQSDETGFFSVSITESVLPARFNTDVFRRDDDGEFFVLAAFINDPDVPGVQTLPPPADGLKVRLIQTN